MKRHDLNPERVNRRELAVPVDGRYAAAVADALDLMYQSGLKTYGQEPGIDAWLMGLSHRGIQIAEIGAAAVAWIGGDCGPNFPSTGDFCRWILARREDGERAARWAESIAVQTDEDRSQVRARLLAAYGTESPSREQISARLKGFASERLLPRPKPVPEGSLWEETPEDSAGERTRRQIEELKAREGR